MAARGTRKRARLNGSNDDNEVVGYGRKRDEEFWYDDGNIILVARDVEFRIYRGLLADHSPVFRDMFSFPVPPPESSSAADPTGDACPVVQLFDSPEDVRHILRFYMPRDDPRYRCSLPGPPQS